MTDETPKPRRNQLPHRRQGVTNALGKLWSDEGLVHASPAPSTNNPYGAFDAATAGTADAAAGAQFVPLRQKQKAAYEARHATPAERAAAGVLDDVQAEAGGQPTGAQAAPDKAANAEAAKMMVAGWDEADRAAIKDALMDAELEANGYSVEPPSDQEIEDRLIDEQATRNVQQQFAEQERLERNEALGYDPDSVPDEDGFIWNDEDES